MNDAIYEVLLRGDIAGAVTGAHVVYFEFDGYGRDGAPRYTPGLPQPLTVSAVGSLLGERTTQLLEQIQALQRDLDAANIRIAELQLAVSTANTQRDEARAAESTAIARAMEFEALLRAATTPAPEAQEG